jgi:hypothetical protein
MKLLLALTYMTLWFIKADGVGHIPPLEVRNPPCGLAGAKVGVTYDRAQDPTTVYWPDPFFPNAHCAVDVRVALATLTPGSYHFATTVMGETGTPPFTIYPDPHVSADWTLGPRTAPPPVTALTLDGTGMQLPATRTLVWDPNTETDLAGYQVTVDGVAYPDTTDTRQVVVLPTYKAYLFAVRAFNTKKEMSEPATLSYLLEAPPACTTGGVHSITIRVEGWTQSVPIGGRGKIDLQLANPFAIVQLQVRLGTQVIGEVTGTDLRDLSGLYFSVPRTPGPYNITVVARDSTGCIEQTTAPRVVTVQ